MGITFGTDGRRAVISDEFTFAYVLGEELTHAKPQ